MDESGIEVDCFRQSEGSNIAGDLVKSCFGDELHIGVSTLLGSIEVDVELIRGFAILDYFPV
jgi:hypothetical protein